MLTFAQLMSILRKYMVTANCRRRQLSEFPDSSNWGGMTGQQRTEALHASKELSYLERIVSLYLDCAELRTERKIPMSMEDWAKRLDGFWSLTETSC